MSEAQAAAADRLPWLADEPKPKAAPARRNGWDFLGWTAAVALLLAGTSFWIGTRNQAPETGQVPSTATAPLPQPAPRQIPIAPRPQVAPAPAVEVSPAPAREVHAAPQRPFHVTRTESRPESQPTEQGSAEEAAKAEAPPSSPPAAAAAQTIARPAPLRPWQPRIVAGAAGRLVEVGAFGTVPQAKRGWRYMVRAYPAVAHLPAVVRPDRNSRGRTFYRFRVGTTSQAHSEVLCQRMQKIHLSCAVVGLPWKAKVER